MFICMLNLSIVRKGFYITRNDSTHWIGILLKTNRSRNNSIRPYYTQLTEIQFTLYIFLCYFRSLILYTLIHWPFDLFRCEQVQIHVLIYISNTSSLLLIKIIVSYCSLCMVAYIILLPTCNINHVNMHHNHVHIRTYTYLCQLSTELCWHATTSRMLAYWTRMSI